MIQDRKHDNQPKIKDNPLVVNYLGDGRLGGDRLSMLSSVRSSRQGSLERVEDIRFASLLEPRRRPLRGFTPSFREDLGDLGEEHLGEENLAATLETLPDDIVLGRRRLASCTPTFVNDE